MQKERIQICRFVEDLLPLELAYGYFISFYYISKVQRDKGHKILILKPAKNFSKKYFINFPTVSIPLRWRGILSSDRKKFVKSAGDIIKLWGADIVHTHISSGVYLHGEQKLPPTIHHLHGLPYQALQILDTIRKMGQKKCRFMDLRHDLHVDILYRTYLKRANTVIVCSPSLRDVVINRYRVSSDKVHVVFNGVSPVFLKSYSKLEARKELVLDEDSFIVLFVGRLIEGKGLIPLLKALQVIRKKQPKKKVKLLIVGSKFGIDWLQSLVRVFSSLGDSVIEVPHVPYEIMPKFYAAADLHILGHTFGLSFPKTCFESLACGTPVIMTKNLDAKIIISQNECGMILDNPTDHIELTKKILYVMENEEVATEWGGNGRKLVSQKYTWERTVEKLNAVYCTVLENT